MTILWFIIGLIIGGTSVIIWNNKARTFQLLDWGLIGLGVLLWILAVSFSTTVALEPFGGAGRAAVIGGMLFAFLALLYSIVIYRYRLMKQ